MNIKKILYITLGCIGVGLGALGAVLPLLPAFPFLLLAAFCFGRSSEKLHTCGYQALQRESGKLCPGQGNDREN